MFVNEIAQRTQIPAHVVRYYTRIGLLKPSRHVENGYKVFSKQDVKRLKFIRKAKALGFTLNDIERIIEEANHGKTPCSLVRVTLEQRIKENRRKLEELMTLQHQMEKTQALWRNMPDGSMPNGDMVCYLIESTEIELKEA
ncbi:MerR family transcriptional regulator [Candidatus Parabeggiatoa sp. HSG14]|uniref:MerR family transcriptional regulator n=1 Tax=Candidatus Parabeggiatoa sp. HSG14 TaxID=3055593 RepID=UPI0025A8C451|nr:MerR family transcriptional regulator [Thiotrichales bacterium HSG14]